MEVDAVVASLKERDKWQGRLTLLQHTLGAIRHRRDEFRRKLKTLQQELKKLETAPPAFERDARSPSGGT